MGEKQSLHIAVQIQALRTPVARSDVLLGVAVTGRGV